MKLTNGEIYSYAIQLSKEFSDSNQFLPVKPNFYIQKNKKMLVELGQEIEIERSKIIESCSTFVDGNMKIIPSKMDEVNQKIEELVNIEQEVPIYSISLEDLGSVSLSTKQMEILMFMID